MTSLKPNISILSFLILLALLFLSDEAASQRRMRRMATSGALKTDSLQLNNDTLMADSLQQDTVSQKKGTGLDAPVSYVANDSLVFTSEGYAHLYGGVEENGQNREKEWAALDGFTRYSNVSAADYHEVRLHMMQVLGWPADEKKLSPQQLEILAELEHIRWCRYHYLNNWKYGVLENGAGKDRAKRIHTDLLAYGELTEAEKQKDRDNIRVLLSVQ